MSNYRPKRKRNYPEENQSKPVGEARRTGNLISNITFVTGTLASLILAIGKSPWWLLLFFPSYLLSAVIWKVGVRIDEKERQQEQETGKKQR